ncbi:hypothetical protein Cgig2_001934 [Carnegiea gigantea]|uniref:Uncharacterized protein n=1 Tax=Carnegiea gigantea TaxID=171969 RepID=A0A9Q1JWP5_9CARY|nr:hypothetical protein Cgig2_001934 [Carnegiea gigantea]
MAMLLNDVVKLGVLSRWMISVMESALKELQWNTFQAWTGRNRGRIMEARRQEASSDSDEACLLSASRPLRPLPEGYRELCPHFVLSKAKEAARDFELPEMVQAIFYATLLNNAVGLGVVGGFLTADLKASLEGSLLQSQLRQRSPPGDAQGSVNGREKSLGSNDPPPPSSAKEGRRSERRKMILLPNFTSADEAAEYVWDTFRWSLRKPPALRPNPLPEDYYGLCQTFVLDVATQYTHDSNIPKMVQAIFCAMVLNDTAKLGLSCRIDMNYIMSVQHRQDRAIMERWLWGIELRLRRAQIPHLANPPADPAASSSTMEDSGLSDPPPASSDEE